MLFWISKIIWAMISPVAILFWLVTLGAFFAWRGKKRLSVAMSCAALTFMWIAGSPFGPAITGGLLENEFLPERRAEDYPNADAIVLLGGGMSVSDDESLAYPDINLAADRVWHAARLYKAGKAPLIITSGVGDEKTTVSFLLDLGVPREAILCEDESRNTAENIKYVKELLLKRQSDSSAAQPKVLLVTSAWHMKRSLLNAKIGGLEVIPAPCDYVASMHNKQFSFLDNWYLPDAERIFNTHFFLKEWVGILQKKLCGGFGG